MKNKYSKKENLNLWYSYHSMKKRCLNPNSTRYKDYGGRGIIICQEWLIGFDIFAEWAYSNGYEKGLTIERKDVNGNYCPENCIWIPKSRQHYNKRTTVFVTYKGKRKCLMDWCNELNLCYDTIHERIKKGWTVEDAFEKPIMQSEDSFASLCRKHGMSPSTVYDRVHKLGWSLDRALNTPSLGLGANGDTYIDKVV